MIRTGPAPDPETVARWWVQLSCWVWPDDLRKPGPPGGMTREQEQYAMRGVHTVLDLLADEDLVNALWGDKETRQALTRRNPEATS